MQYYICPPKLQVKFLLIFWTVIELLVFFALLCLSFAVDFRILALAFVYLICTARLDLEQSIFQKLFIRFKFYQSAKTFRIQNKTATASPQR